MLAGARMSGTYPTPTFEVLADGCRALVHVVGCVLREVAPVEEERARVVVYTTYMVLMCYCCSGMVA